MTSSRIPMPETYRLTDYRPLEDQYQYYPPKYTTEPYIPDNVYGRSRSNSDQRPGREPRDLSARTPSPTPSEIESLNGTSSGIIPWDKLKSKEFWFSKQGILTGVLILVGGALMILFLIFHDQIILDLTPYTDWAKGQRFGWLIPVGILFIMSFPPLFGHQFVGLLCGVTWGFAEGFAIVALGTLLGEIANFFAFKYCCTARAHKYEKKKIMYACLTKIMREGGFKVAVAARYSIIPPHMTTAIFASSGLPFFVFLGAAICSLPKQLSDVLLGVLLADESIDGTSKKEKFATIAVFGVTILITSFTIKFLNREMDKVRPQVIYERRKARQVDFQKIASSSDSDSFHAP